MKRVFLLSCVVLCLMLGSGPDVTMAQDGDRPLVEVSIAETEVIPGQPAVMRITVLVPTWLAQPVAFPTFEAPDLMVKLLEGSTNPTSRTIDGETWSGVSRAYRLSPMVPGPIRIPSQELRILWAEPGQTDPNTDVVPLDEIQITGITPDGAGDLDPFIAATELTLEQDISTEDRVLKPGDSLTRTVTARIKGTSPLFLPALLQPQAIQGVAAYPAEPVVSETADRTWVSGTRQESTTLVAESGGSGTLPSIELRWYNLDSGKVETAHVDGLDLTVDAPVARERPEIDARTIALIALLVVSTALAGYLIHRFVRPRVRLALDQRRARRLASEDWAYAQLRKAIRGRDYRGTVQALAIWAPRLPGLDPGSDASVVAAMADLGNCLYGPEPSDTTAAWTKLQSVIGDTRRQALRDAHHAARHALAPLNPT